MATNNHSANGRRTRSVTAGRLVFFSFAGKAITCCSCSISHHRLFSFSAYTLLLQDNPILERIITDPSPTDITSKIENPNPPHYCQVDRCEFTSGTARGILEHQKNKHLGKVCYWRFQNGGFCGHHTQTHEELYQHFNSVHLATTGRQGPPFQCQWPGGPAITIPNGPSLPEESQCTQMLQKKSSAERHAREHQYKIWRKVEESAAAHQEGEDE
ncbi:hypothetical protein RRF57_009385 [Xylaria bambusicola]|uniref:Uncharacterized protein n=1 Tax=Xylaria bambusicola TaxID=326684 RepID=A0AAN7UWR1_9PEZI